MPYAPEAFRVNHGSRRRSARYQSLYNSPAWKRLSKVIRRRDPICKLCDDRPSTQADHIKAIADGGSVYDPVNLQGICGTCHAIKSIAERDSRSGVAT